MDKLLPLTALQVSTGIIVAGIISLITTAASPTMIMVYGQTLVSSSSSNHGIGDMILLIPIITTTR